MDVLKQLFLKEYAQFDQKKTSELPKITIPDEVAKRPPYRNPGPFVISVMSLVCDIGVHLDIDNRAFFESVRPHILNSELLTQKNFIELPGIIDIQYRSLSYGSTTFGEKKNKTSRQNTFGNQCTMRILFEDSEFDEGYNIINVKLFTNGTMQFTGITSVTQAQECIDIITPLLQRLVHISKVHENINDFFRDYSFRNYKLLVQSDVKTSVKTHTHADTQPRVFQNKNTILAIFKHLSQKDIFVMSQTCKFFWKILTSKNHTFWKSLIHYRFGVLHVYHPTLKNHLINVNTFKTTIPKISLKKDYFLRSAEFETSNYKPNVLLTGPMKKLEMSNESIELINSNFNTRFFIDQRKLTKILQKQYPYLDSSYEPDDKYHGIKVYWPHPDTVQANGDNSGTVKIFISIFRTGSILMSAAKTTQQLNDAYKFINGVLRENYEKIWIPDDA